MRRIAGIDNRWRLLHHNAFAPRTFIAHPFRPRVRWRAAQAFVKLLSAIPTCVLVDETFEFNLQNRIAAFTTAASRSGRVIDTFPLATMSLSFRGRYGAFPAFPLSRDYLAFRQFVRGIENKQWLPVHQEIYDMPLSRL